MLDFITDITSSIGDIDFNVESGAFDTLYDVFRFIAYFVDFKLVISIFSISIILDIIDIVFSVVLRLKSLLAIKIF